VLISIALMYVAMTLAAATAQRPGCDEAWFGGPGYNLAFHGYMGTPALEPATVFEAGRNLAGIDRHTYWIMPLSPVTQAAWYNLVGFSLVAMRSLSLLWGGVALGAWWVILRKWKLDPRVTLLAFGFIALDYAFVRSAAHGRMDMMCAALNFSAFAAYVSFRERSLPWAILAGHTLAALSCLTHPNGILGLIGLVILTALFDSARIRWWYVGIAAAPYFVAAGAWSLYIAEDPAIFRIQMSGNTAGRFRGLRDPLEALRAELRDRYLGGATGAVSALRAIQAAPYLLSALLALCTPTVRKHDGLRAILWLSGAEFLYFWLLEGTKLYLYVVHISPLLMILLAAGIVHGLWETWYVPRWVLKSGVAIWVIVQVGGVLYVVRRNDLGKEYVPAIRYLREHAASQALIMGSAELGFQLGFSKGLVDDVKLGFVTGKHPDFVVVERRYREWFEYAKTKEPATYEHIRHLLDNNMRRVYHGGSYEIYSRASTSP